MFVTVHVEKIISTLHPVVHIEYTLKRVCAWRRIHILRARGWYTWAQSMYDSLLEISQLRVHVDIICDILRFLFRFDAREKPNLKWLVGDYCSVKCNADLFRIRNLLGNEIEYAWERKLKVVWRASEQWWLETWYGNHTFIKSECIHSEKQVWSYMNVAYFNW